MCTQMRPRYLTKYFKCNFRQHYSSFTNIFIWSRNQDIPHFHTYIIYLNNPAALMTMLKQKTQSKQRNNKLFPRSPLTFPLQKPTICIDISYSFCRNTANGLLCSCSHHFEHCRQMEKQVLTTFHSLHASHFLNSMQRK